MFVLPGDKEKRVRVVRDKGGRLVGYQDPDRGNVFITREEAVKRLRFSEPDRQIVDSFGTPVGPGGIAMPGVGRTVAYKVKEAVYQPLTKDPRQFRPDVNQEIIEKTTFIDESGLLTTDEVSSGYGRRWDPAKTGGRWRRKASEALGLGEEERLPTRRLEKAVYFKEFIVKTTRSRSG